MENKGKKTGSLILGIVGAVFSIVSIPMYLLSLITIKLPDLLALLGVDIGNITIKLKDIFSALSLLKNLEGTEIADNDYFGMVIYDLASDPAYLAKIKTALTMVVVLVFVGMFFNILTAAFSAIPKKMIKIGGIVTGLVATVMPAVLAIVFKSAINKVLTAEGEDLLELIDINVSIGMGLILPIVFSALALILVVVAMILAPKKAAIDGYDQGAYDQAAYDPNAGYAQQGAYDQQGFAAAPQPTTQITFLSGSNAGFQIPIVPGQPIFIGKDPNQCSVVIDKKYSKVSRLHCSIDFDPNSGAYIVTDYSTNGTNVVGGSKLPRNTASYVERGATINLAHTENAIRLD